MIFSREWKSLIIPDGPLELKLVSKLNYRTPQTTLRFQLLDAGVSIGSFSACVKTALWKDVWVASGSINRGTLLPEAKWSSSGWISSRIERFMGRQSFGQSILVSGGDFAGPFDLRAVQWG